jgi:hypothetical protein
VRCVSPDNRTNMMMMARPQPCECVCERQSQNIRTQLPGHGRGERESNRPVCLQSFESLVECVEHKSLFQIGKSGERKFIADFVISKLFHLQKLDEGISEIEKKRAEQRKYPCM